MAIISGGSGSSSGGGLALITSQTLAAPAANLTLSSIPATYTHLYMVYRIRSAVTSETTALGRVQFNGDTGANYGRQHIWGQNTGANVGTSGGLIAFNDITIESGPSAVANGFAQGTLLIPFYRSTTQLKQVIGHSSVFGATGATANWIAALLSGIWNSTAAINAIAFLASDGASNLATGCSVSLYGMA